MSPETEMRRIILSGVGVLIMTGCGMPMAGGQCRTYEPVLFDCSDDYVEVCDNSAGCEQCTCVLAEDTRASGPYGQSRRR